MISYLFNYANFTWVLALRNYFVLRPIFPNINFLGFFKLLALQFDDFFLVFN